MEVLAAIGGLAGLVVGLIVMVVFVMAIFIFGGFLLAIVGAVISMACMLIGFFFEIIFTLSGLFIAAALVITLLVVLNILPAVVLAVVALIVLAAVATKSQHRR